MSGLMHIYYGDGKGKTTAAIGLALRAKGCQKNVVIVQFLKGMPTSEEKCLSELGISILRCDTCKFVQDMSEEEKAALKKKHDANILAALEMHPEVLVLDEFLDAAELGLVSNQLIEKAVYKKSENTELIITGHVKNERLFDAADYITEMKKIKHPFDRGVTARRGIEF